VISGYLITQLLEESRDESAPRRLATFYVRRMRRILPALLATCLVTAIVAVALFTPDQLVNVGKFLAATPVMLSNLATWTRGDYFAPGVRQLPLSHLWSISVEEQFYLLYPLLLIATGRYRLPYRRLTLILLASVSLASCVWASHRAPEANYVFAPTRASLYLWHQPLLVFANYYYIAPLRPAATAALLVATLLVATASWRFIERPVRARIVMKSTRTLLVGVGVASAGILLAGLVLWNSDGFPQRFPPETRGLIVSMTATPELVRCVEEVSLDQVRAGRVCNYGPGDPTPKVLFWGDSHALAMMPAVKELAKAHGMHLYFVAKYNGLGRRRTSATRARRRCRHRTDRQPSRPSLALNLRRILSSNVEVRSFRCAVRGAPPAHSR